MCVDNRIAAHIIEEHIVNAKMTSWRQDPDELFTQPSDTLANASIMLHYIVQFYSNNVRF